MKRGSKVKDIGEVKKADMLYDIVHSFFGGITKVYADEGDSSDDEGGDAGDEDDKKKKPRINCEDLIAKARKEEKDKQYKKIKSLEADRDSAVKKQNELLLENASLKDEIQELNTKLSKASDGDIEAVVQLKDQLAQLQKEKEEVETELASLKENADVSEEVENRIRAEVEEEYEVKLYRAELLAEHKDDLLVPELVTGTTKEELEESLASALERSAEIAEKLGADPKKKTAKKPPKKGTPKTPSNPSVDGIQGQTLSAEYIATLDVTSPEYAEVRKQLGLK